MQNEKRAEYCYSVDEAVSVLMNRLAETTGFKYLKGSRCLKKTIGKLVFQISLFSSKWNLSGRRIEIEMGYCLSNKEYGTVNTVNSIVASKLFRTASGRYYDVTTPENLEKTFSELNSRIHADVITLVDLFSESTQKGCLRLLEDDVFESSNVALDYIMHILGRETIKPRVEIIRRKLTDNQKREIVAYKSGERSKAWMMNRSNLRFLVDSGFL